MKVSKEMFVEQLVRNYSYTWSSANMLVNDFLSCILDNIEAGRAVGFHGFGCFDILTYAERAYYCPHIDKRISLPEHCVPSFIPGRNMKRAAKKFEEHYMAAKESSAPSGVQSYEKFD